MAKDQDLSDPTPLDTRVGRLAGKVALITGAAGAIGGHVVRAYLREGATVIMTGRTQNRVEAAAAAAIEQTGAAPERVMTVVLDGGDMASVRAGVKAVVDRFGRIDVLVNNAGSAGPKTPLDQLPMDAEELEALRRPALRTRRR